MKILQIINAFYPPCSYGGAAFVAHDISKELAKRGHKVTVYTTNMLSREKMFYSMHKPKYYEGIEVYYFHNTLFKPKLYSYFSNELFKAIKENISNYDIVHMHEYRSYISIIANHYAKKNNTPLILQAHGQLPRTMTLPKVKWIYDVLFGYRLLRDASMVIALSQMEAEQYMGMGIPEEKIVIIPNGIDLSEFADLPPKGAFKETFNIPKDNKIILYVGRIHWTKGIDFLLKAFAYLINKMSFKDVLLVVVGPDDGYLHEVKSLSSSLGVSNSVLFTGLISNKDKISAYVDSNVTVNVEPTNVFGLVPLEAAACSTPVIVSKGNAISKIVNRGKFGFSVDYNDLTGLVEIMRKLISDVLRNEMGKCGRKYVFENFGWDTIIDKYEMLYGDIIERTRMELT